MTAKDKLIGLDEAQASELLKMAALGYKISKPVTPSTKSESTYDDLMNMVGCEEAKKTIERVVASVRMNRILQARGMSVNVVHYHMAFMGAPGSAKTTTAQLYAGILYAEGLIKTKKLITLTKADLVGKYQGHTAKLVREKVKACRGAAVLIDEAYSLDDTDNVNSNTYGAEAIDELILQLEEATDTIFIFAGYTDKMQAFLDANPGLRSRIPIIVNFPDYTTQELLAICQKMAQDRGYIISNEAVNKITGILDKAKTQVNFGNGRYCRNFIENAISEKSVRLGIMDKGFDYARFADVKSISDEELFTLDAECFKGPAEVQKDPKRKIGF